MLKGLIVFSFLLFIANCAFNGVDVSVWDGPNINYQTVKNSGINFVIIRAGYRGSVDKYFELNYRNAKAVGLNVGAYWYSYANSIDDSTREANAFLGALRGKQFEYPVFYDIEEKSIFAKGMEFTSGIAKNFCLIMESKKYYCGIYCSQYFLKTYFTHEVKHRFDIWVAQYNHKCTYDEPYTIWQRGEGRVPGMPESADLDVSYVDYPPVMKKHHLNGF